MKILPWLEAFRSQDKGSTFLFDLIFTKENCADRSKFGNFLGNQPEQ